MSDFPEKRDAQGIDTVETSATLRTGTLGESSGDEETIVSEETGSAVFTVDQADTCSTAEIFTMSTGHGTAMTGVQMSDGAETVDRHACK